MAPARRALLRRQLVQIRRLGGGPVAGDGRAMHHALLAGAVPGTPAMQHAAVVPHHQVAHAPRVAEDAVWSGRQLEELGDEDPALVDAEALDAPGVGADVEVLLAVSRLARTRA